MLTFTKKGNDSITMERTKMIKWLYYYGMEGVLNLKFVRNIKSWAKFMVLWTNFSFLFYSIMTCHYLFYFLILFHCHSSYLILLVILFYLSQHNSDGTLKARMRISRGSNIDKLHWYMYSNSPCVWCRKHFKDFTHYVLLIKITDKLSIFQTF